jgi:hypothetical protein
VFSEGPCREFKLRRSKLFKNNQREKGKNWSRVPDGCLTPGRTGRLTVGRNITLTLTFDRGQFSSL